MEYKFRVLVVQDGPLDTRRVIGSLLSAISKLADQDAGIVVGPDEINSEEDFDSIISHHRYLDRVLEE